MHAFLFVLTLSFSHPSFAAEPSSPGLAVFTAKLANAMNGRKSDEPALEKLRKAGTFKKSEGLRFEAVGNSICHVEGEVQACWGPAMRNGAVGIQFDGIDRVFTPTKPDEKVFIKELTLFLKQNEEPKGASIWQRFFLETAHAEPYYAMIDGKYTYDKKTMQSVYASYMGWFQMPAKYGAVSAGADKYYSEQLAEVVTGRTFRRTGINIRKPYNDVRPLTGAVCKGDAARITTTTPSGMPVVVKPSGEGKFRVHMQGRELEVTLTRASSLAKCRTIHVLGKHARNADGDDAEEQRHESFDPERRNETERFIVDKAHELKEKSSGSMVSVDSLGKGKVKVGAVGKFWKNEQEFSKFEFCNYPLPEKTVRVSECKNASCDKSEDAMEPWWASFMGNNREESRSLLELEAKYHAAKEEAQSLRNSPPPGLDGAAIAGKIKEKKDEASRYWDSMRNLPGGNPCDPWENQGDCSKRMSLDFTESMSRLALRAVAAGKCCEEPRCRLHMFEKEGEVNFKDGDLDADPNTGSAQ